MPGPGAGGLQRHALAPLERLAPTFAALAPSLHNSATPSQRKRLLESLQAYRDDIRALAPPSIRTP